MGKCIALHIEGKILYIQEAHSVSSRECRIETMKEINIAHDISRLYRVNVSWSSLSTFHVIKDKSGRI